MWDMMQQIFIKTKALSNINSRRKGQVILNKKQAWKKKRNWLFLKLLQMTANPKAQIL